MTLQKYKINATLDLLFIKLGYGHRVYLKFLKTTYQILNYCIIKENEDEHAL